MGLPITSQLPNRSPEENAEAWNDVAATLETAGWTELKGAIDARLEQLQSDLLNKSPRESVGEYERVIGEMRGLRSIDSIIDGLKARAEEAIQ